MEGPNFNWDLLDAPNVLLCEMSRLLCIMPPIVSGSHFSLTNFPPQLSASLLSLPPLFSGVQGQNRLVSCIPLSSRLPLACCPALSGLGPQCIIVYRT